MMNDDHSHSKLWHSRLEALLYDVQVSQYLQYVAMISLYYNLPVVPTCTAPANPPPTANNPSTVAIVLLPCVDSTTL